jgi:sulfonate transport system substrate-binding protein
MQTTISTEDIHRSVISVPPLCRDANFKSDAEENAKLIKHIESGGVNIMLYGGNANFYNIGLYEYAAIIDELARLDAWATKNPSDVAKFLAPQIGLDLGVTEVAASRFAYGIQPISAKVAADQQKIADAFFELKLIPKAIKVSDALPATLTAAR